MIVFRMVLMSTFVSEWSEVTSASGSETGVGNNLASSLLHVNMQLHNEGYSWGFWGLLVENGQNIQDRVQKFLKWCR